LSAPRLPTWPRVLALAEAVRAAGGRAFLVGGAVRDRLLGQPGRDADVEVHGLAPDVVERLVAAQGRVHLVGRQFAVLHVATPEGELEVSLPRRESKTGPGHKGFAVTADPQLGPTEAARRRDFTVNAMLEDPLTGEVLDPFGGRDDLRRGLLRHVSAAFAEDPLRVLRAGRFAARFGWRVHAETSALCRTLDLAELPRERIEREWQEILLHGAFPGQGLRVLEACGALRAFPELAALRGVPQDPVWHPEGDVLTHTALCLDAAVTVRPAMEDPWLEMLAVLCHDLGKANTTVFERGRWRSAMHDETGAPLTIALLARITDRAGLAESAAALVREHLRPGQFHLVRDQIGDAAIRRLATRVDLRALVRVAWSDAAGRQMPMPNPWPAAEWLLARAAALGVRESAPTPFLLGRDVLELGVPPGPRVGALLREAFEAQLDGRLADRAQALVWLRAQLA
jgi:tRNA nucleotidyltransferase (CCA-adding enzyme)